MKCSLHTILLVCLVFSIQAETQTNWPSFRGPNALGIADDADTATTWDVAQSKNILWKTAVSGLGHSSPIVWGDRLFITTAVNRNGNAPLKVGLYGDPASANDDDVQQWKIFCLNKKTGEVLWQATAFEGAPRVRRHPKATHANCTMATDGDCVVAFFGSEGLYSYDMGGHPRWKKDFGILRSSPEVYNDAIDTNGLTLEWGFASSPVIYGQRVFVQCDQMSSGFVAALDLANGNEVWRTRRDDTATWSTPTVCANARRPQLIVNGWTNMGGYDLQTGEQIWRLSGGGDCPVPTPVVWNNLVFLMSAHGPHKPIYAVKTDAVGNISSRRGASTNEHVAWSVPGGASYMETPLICGNYLYSCQSSGILSCYAAATGELMYKERLGSGGDGFTASPVASPGKMYFASEEGTVYVVKPSTNFTVLATNHMGEVCMATPAISGGAIFFRTQGHVVAVGEEKGESRK